jgi:Cu+-exporting ATPase
MELDPACVNLRALVEAAGRAGYDVPREAHEFEIFGMTCATCSGRIETILKGFFGVIRADVNLASERVSVESIVGTLRPAALVNAVRAAGYDAELITNDREHDPQLLSVEERLGHEMCRTIAAIALSVPLLLPMVGVTLPGWLAFLLATPVQFVVGGRFHSGAWKALRAGVCNMDLLVSLGTSVAYFYSVYLLLLGPVDSHPYFEVAAVAIALIVLGKWLKLQAKRSTRDAIRALMSLRPDTACIERGGIEIDGPADAVAIGDIVIVRPGERLPIDGSVVSGESDVDESLLTGQSMPVDKCAGAKVTSGSINGSGLLRVKATAVGEHSTLSLIIGRIEHAQGRKPLIQHIFDCVATIYVAIVFGTVLITFLGWRLIVDRHADRG